MTGQGADAPFLSVLVPVGVAGAQALRESLLCLAGQDDDDFELVLVAAALPAAGLEAVEEVVSDQLPRLSQRLRLVETDAATPGAVRNAGLAAAQGRYVTVLPEGDLALGRWVRALHDAEQASSGQVLRALAVTQPYTLADVRGVEAVRAEGAPRSDSPATFSLWQHALEPRSPASSWAWPRSLVQDRGVEYNPAVADDADWELLVRAAGLVGVSDVGVVTSLHREWDPSSQSSASAPGPTARKIIDSRPLLLPAGEAGLMRADSSASASTQALKEELARTTEELRLTHNHAANLEAVVRSLEAQAEKAARRHTQELNRLRRTADGPAGQGPSRADAAPEGAPPGRSWLQRRRGTSAER